MRLVDSHPCIIFIKCGVTVSELSLTHGENPESLLGLGTALSLYSSTLILVIYRGVIVLNFSRLFNLGV